MHFVAMVHPSPSPPGHAGAPLQALVFDSHYDPYKGVVVYVRLEAGTPCELLRLEPSVVARLKEILK